MRGLSLAGRGEDGVGCPAEVGELVDVGCEVCHWFRGAALMGKNL